MSEKIIIEAKDVRLKHGDGREFGPLNFSLKAGEGILIEVPYLDLLRRLMRCCQSQERPEAGIFIWDLGVYPDEDSRWARYDFLRRIGFVDRDSRLLESLSFRRTLELYFSYARQDGELASIEAIMEEFNLKQWADWRTDDLPEPVRRLVLYALALAKKPRLLLMERPVQFLDLDFKKIWARIRKMARQEGLCFIIFDRSLALYEPEQFKEILRFKPAAAG